MYTCSSATIKSFFSALFLQSKLNDHSLSLMLQCQVTSVKCTSVKSVLFLHRSEEKYTCKEVLVLLIHYSYVTEIFVIIVILKIQKFQNIIIQLYLKISVIAWYKKRTTCTSGENLIYLKVHVWVNILGTTRLRNKKVIFSILTSLLSQFPCVCS